MRTKYNRLHKRRIKHEQQNVCYRAARSRRSRNRLARKPKGVIGKEAPAQRLRRPRRMVRSTPSYGIRRSVRRGVRTGSTQRNAQPVDPTDTPTETKTKLSGRVIPDIWERDGFYRTLLHHNETMCEVFQYSKKRADYYDRYPNGVRIIHQKEGWRLQAEQWIADGRFDGHYMFRQTSTKEAG
jgi:hypothetical protein